MKRKHDESRLSQLLFNKSKDLVDKLKHIECPDNEFERTAVWIDEDDEHYAKPSPKIKPNYAEKLKQKYETLMGTPNWAKLNNPNIEHGENDEILRTVGHIRKKDKIQLPKDFLEISKLQHINSETKNEGRIISCIEFHPSLSVSLVGGNSGTVSLFTIAGEDNKKLHSFKLKNWSITSAQFAPNGTEAFLSTKLNHSYCVYDLIKAQPKLTQLPQLVTRPSIFKLSPDGKIIATSGGYDEIFLINTQSKELLRILKHNANIESLSFSNDCDKLYCYSVEGEITIWDLAAYRVLKKFYDNGCVKASCISISPCGRLLATGSSEGIVNIYETSKLDTLEPSPIKTVTNLTTKISNLKFNATTEILAASSGVLSNAVKLIHIPSYHVFTNFPDQFANLSQIHTVNFSPNSGYMAMGNDKGCAYLYRLKYYKNY